MYDETKIKKTELKWNKDKSKIRKREMKME